MHCSAFYKIISLVLCKNTSKTKLLRKRTMCSSLYIQLIPIFQCSKGVDCAYESVSTLCDIFKKKRLKNNFFNCKCGRKVFGP